MKKLVILGTNHSHYKSIIKAALARNDIEFTVVAQEGSPDVSALANEYGVKCYSDYRECLSQEQPDIAGIAMPNGFRGDWVRRCAQRNIAVISDKPICTELNQLEEIKTAHDASNAPISMMLTCRCAPQYVAVRDVVQNGDIGDVLSLEAVRYYALNRPSRPDWMFHSKTYGGPGLDILIHDYDLARWITGIAWNDITLREIRTGRYVDEDFQDMAYITAEDDNRPLYLKMMWHSPAGHRDRFTVYGTRGLIDIPLSDKEPIIIDSKGYSMKLQLPDTKSFCEMFFDAYLDGDSKYPITFDEIYSCSRNILAARNC